MKAITSYPSAPVAGPSNTKAKLSKISSADSTGKAARANILDIIDRKPSASAEFRQIDQPSKKDPFAELYDDPLSAAPISRPASISRPPTRPVPYVSTLSRPLSQSKDQNIRRDVKPIVQSSEMQAAETRSNSDSDIEVLDGDAVPGGMRKVNNKYNPFTVDDDSPVRPSLSLPAVDAVPSTMPGVQKTSSFPEHDFFSRHNRKSSVKTDFLQADPQKPRPRPCLLCPHPRSERDIEQRCHIYKLA